MHWTISRLKDYESCPKKHEYKSVLRVPEPGPKSPALQRGIDWHADIERFLLGQQDHLTIPLSTAWQREIYTLRKLQAQSEQMWEFDADWHPYTHNAEHPLWLRMKLDANYRRRRRESMHVIDFKTGKCYPADRDQIEVYALGTFGLHDDVEEVLGSLWYLDGGEPLDRTIKRQEAPKLARKWEGRAQRLLDAKTFPANPSKRTCGWCPFKAICPEAAA